MSTYANVALSPPVDGWPYATNAVVPSVEADLGTPLSVTFEQAALVILTLAVSGSPSGNAAFAVLQTSLADGSWVDLAWLVWSATSGSATFALSAGAFSANVFQQSRTPGTSPGSNGSNQSGLGGKIRVVGQSTLTGGSAPKVTATVTVKLLGLR